jgi:rhodanese-related sulfurtransferase
VRLNKVGYTSIDVVLKQGTHALSPAEFEAVAAETDALVLDTRAPEVFAQGFVPGAINIGLNGNFAPWVGALIPDVGQPLLLVTDPGYEEEAVTRLARVGYDQTLGVLRGGVAAWQEAGLTTNQLPSVPAQELAARYAGAEAAPVVIDVRKASEFANGAVADALNVPLDFLNEHLAEIPTTGLVYVHCAGGYRSMIACSILHARGWQNVIDVGGGFKALQATSIPQRGPLTPA